MEHPSDDLLEHLSMRHLTEAEMALLEEHLLNCEECRNLVVQMDLVNAAMRETLRQVQKTN